MGADRGKHSKSPAGEVPIGLQKEFNITTEQLHKTWTHYTLLRNDDFEISRAVALTKELDREAGTKVCDYLIALGLELITAEVIKGLA